MAKKYTLTSDININGSSQMSVGTYTTNLPNYSGGNGISVWGTHNTSFGSYSVSMNKIYILGDYIEINLISDIDINIIATLNVLGEPYWNELKRLNGHGGLSTEITEFIEKRIKIEKRNKKIDTIL